MLTALMHPIANALGFQLGWWVTILSVPLGWDRPAMLFAGLLTFIHLRGARVPRADLQLGLAVMCLGIGVDSLLQCLSFIQFRGWSFWNLSPPWLWSLWWLFSLTLNSSLGFLQRLSWPWVGLIGGLAGPASYLGGAALGAADLDTSRGSILALALAWMVALPITVRMATTFPRTVAPSKPSDAEHPHPGG